MPTINPESHKKQANPRNPETGTVRFNPGLIDASMVCFVMVSEV
jgi:hypothetical protein